ncbi:MAG: TerD family protein [Dysosmobacter welbionis]
MELQKGQKCKLADLTGSGQLRISVTVSLPGSEADVTCFGVDGAGKLSDDRYFIFYNQTSSPEGAVSMHQSGESTVFSVDLNRLPGFLQRLVVTVAAESGTMQALARGLLTLEGELDRAAYVFTGAGYQQERPDSLQVYRKDGIWRFPWWTAASTGDSPHCWPTSAGRRSSLTRRPRHLLRRSRR